MWVVADLDDDYIAKMEDVLELYEQPYDAQQPVICLDEKPITLHADLRPATPARPGREARRDNEYERRGTANNRCEEKTPNRARCSVTFRRRSAYRRSIRYGRSGRWRMWLLKALSPVFDRMYAAFGRPSIAPEKLLRALLIQVLYTVRSERMLMEQLQYNLLFRWFVGMNMDEPVWVPTVFSKNRDRLMEGDLAERFFTLILDQAGAAGLLSDEHFSVDGTLIEAWARQKSFQRKDTPEAVPPDDPGNPTVNFHGKPAATTRMNRRQTRTHDWRARAGSMNRSWRIAATL